MQTIHDERCKKFKMQKIQDAKNSRCKKFKMQKIQDATNFQYVPRKREGLLQGSRHESMERIHPSPG